jgi:hypothetical protein
VRLRPAAADDEEHDDTRVIDVTAEGSARSSSLEAELAIALGSVRDEDVPRPR